MPTDTFSITASGNDKYVGKSDAAYPLGGAVTHDTTSTSLYAERSFFGGYVMENALMKWDTSSLPDSAIVSSALVRLDVLSKTNTDSLSVTMDWRVFDGTSADFSHAALTTAHTGTTLASITVGVTKDFALANLSNISLTGTTGVRVHISQRASDAAPTGGNAFEFASFDHTTRVEPKLLVTYTLGGGDLVGEVGI